MSISYDDKYEYYWFIINVQQHELIKKIYIHRAENKQQGINGRITNKSSFIISTIHSTLLSFATTTT